MTVYNVVVRVVDLVEANSPDEAIGKLVAHLDHKGYEVMPDEANAFESEPLPEGTAVLV